MLEWFEQIWSFVLRRLHSGCLAVSVLRLYRTLFAVKTETLASTGPSDKGIRTAS